MVRLSGSRSALAQQAAAAGVPLTQPSYALLRIMNDGGGVTMGELARLAHLDLALPNRQVSKLVVATAEQQRVEDLVGQHGLQGVPAVGADQRLQPVLQLGPAVPLEGRAIAGGGVEEGEQPSLPLPLRRDRLVIGTGGQRRGRH